MRCFTGKILKTFHLLAVLMRTHHNGFNMFNKIMELFQAVNGNQWYQKVIETATNGAAPVVAKVARAVTRLEQIMPKGMYRAWCGAHQLDLADKSAFETMAATFQEPQYNLIAYLRRQVNLKAEMGTARLTVSATRLLILGEVCK